MSKTYQCFLPADDVNDEHATIVKLFFKSGEKVNKGDLIFSFETSKAIIDVESEFEGFIQYVTSEGEKIDIGSLVCEISKNKKELFGERKNIIIKNQKNFKLTKKADILVQKYELEIEELGLNGIIKEKDLIPFIQNERQITPVDKCLKLDKNNIFVQQLLNDELFRNLLSKEKIEKYKLNGHKVGKNVNISERAVLIGNKIEIQDNVSIGVGTYIESPEIFIGANTSIGNDCNFVASSISIGEYNNISNKVCVDISGGRYPDSNFITGKGCLFAFETYINVCRQVRIGQNVALSPKSMIYTHSYWQSVLNGYDATFGPVTVEDNSWIGSMAQILPNINVSTGSIIISNSFVTSDVKPFTMVGGVPAKIIKESLKKNLSRKNKEKIIIGLFYELCDWLHSHHFDIQKVNERLIIINYNKVKKSCLLFDKNMDSMKEKIPIDIVISTSSPNNIPTMVKTVFDIENEIVQGPLENIETMIVEFFRRRGIRFYGG